MPSSTLAKTPRRRAAPQTTPKPSQTSSAPWGELLDSATPNSLSFIHTKSLDVRFAYHVSNFSHPQKLVDAFVTECEEDVKRLQADLHQRRRTLAEKNILEHKLKILKAEEETWKLVSILRKDVPDPNWQEELPGKMTPVVARENLLQLVGFNSPTEPDNPPV